MAGLWHYPHQCHVSFVVFGHFLTWHLARSGHPRSIGGAADQNNAEAVAAMACEGVKGVIDWDKSREPLADQRRERKILGDPLVNIQTTMENHHVEWENPLFLWPFFK